MTLRGIYTGHESNEIAVKSKSVSRCLMAATPLAILLLYPRLGE